MPKRTDLYVVLDANILIQDFWLKGKGFSYLMLNQFLEHRPVIPEVAYLEVRNHLKNRAETLLSNQKHSEGNLRRLISVFNYEEDSNDYLWDINLLLARWEENFNKIFEEHNGLILPTPELDVNGLVTRSIERKKPFSKGDKGFRDTLIWLSTLNLIDEYSGVSFITNNTHDFFTSDSGKPHPEILSEADEKLDEFSQMLFFRSIDDFIAYLDSDKSASSRALHRALTSDNLSKFSLWSWLEDHIHEIIKEHGSNSTQWAGLPGQAQEVELQDIERLISLDISLVDHLTVDSYRILFDFSFTGYFQCSLPLEMADEVFNPNQVLWKNESDSIWTDVGFQAVGTFLGFIDFELKSRTVTACYVIPLAHWENYDNEIDKL